MKDKPTKWGMKVWTLRDARTGYIYRSLVYTGKSLTERQHGLLGNRVVCALSRSLNIHVFIFTNNCLTSTFSFLYILVSTCTPTTSTATGVIPASARTQDLFLRKHQANRKGFSRALHMTKAKNNCTAVGTIEWTVSSPLLCVTWKNQRLARVISTIHPLKENNIRCQVRRSTGPTPTILNCPVAIRNYYLYKRGVDRGDEIVTIYNAGRRTKSGTKKWNKRMVEANSSSMKSNGCFSMRTSFITANSHKDNCFSPSSQSSSKS